MKACLLPSWGSVGWHIPPGAKGLRGKWGGRDLAHSWGGYGNADSFSHHETCLGRDASKSLYRFSRNPCLGACCLDTDLGTKELSQALGGAQPPSCTGFLSV